MKCDAKIRPFPVGNDTEVVCEVDEDGHMTHRGMIRDYAYPGSLTNIDWQESDRRNFHGKWPGRCWYTTPGGDWAGCVLPAGHRGNHTA